MREIAARLLAAADAVAPDIGLVYDRRRSRTADARVTIVLTPTLFADDMADALRGAADAVRREAGVAADGVRVAPAA